MRHRNRSWSFTITSSILLLIFLAMLGVGSGTWQPSQQHRLSSTTSPVSIPVQQSAPNPPHPPTLPPNNRPTRTSLPIGKPLRVDTWQVALLDPAHTRVLTTSVGTLDDTEGQFVVASMAIGNTADTARRVPEDLFVLTDAQGRSYRVVPGASTTYLEVFGRGRHGDLAFEDAIPPGGGLHSVPVLFNVPLDASGLMLTLVGYDHQGWVIEE